MNTYGSIRLTDKPERHKWAAFIASHPSGNIFQSPAMQSLYEGVTNYNPGVIAAVDSSGNIKGILAYNIIREPGIQKILTARSIITGGPIVQDNDPYYAALLFEQYKKNIRASNVIYTQIRNLSDMDFIKESAANNGFVYEDHLTIHIDLSQSIPRLEAGMHKKRRANIRRMSKKKVVIKPVQSAEEYAQVYELIKNTYRRIKLPAPPEELLLNAKVNLNDHVRFLSAYYDGEMIACRIYLLYKEIMYDWYAGSNLSYSHLCPNDILPWEAMLWGKLNGMHTYDFAGAGKPGKEYGVRTYKSKFGGVLYNFGRYQCVHKPLLFGIGTIAMKIWKLIR